MRDLRICAVIPAAGRGTRLGLDTPKIMLELADGCTVWHQLNRRLRPWVDHAHVVVSRAAEAPFRDLAADEIRCGAVSVSVQDEPRGMGDAIFGASWHWATYDAIVVVWGDQATLSATTMRETVCVHRQATSAGHPGLTIPLVPMPDPYVEYELTSANGLRVRMSREGDECRPGGLSDVGVFCLSTDGLVSIWKRHLLDTDVGAATGEVNFLPLLPVLSRIPGWRLTVVPVVDPDQARGINTEDDLEFARRAFRDA